MAKLYVILHRPNDRPTSDRPRVRVGPPTDRTPRARAVALGPHAAPCLLATQMRQTQTTRPPSATPHPLGASRSCNWPRTAAWVPFLSIPPPPRGAAEVWGSSFFIVEGPTHDTHPPRPGPSASPRTRRGARSRRSRRSAALRSCEAAPAPSRPVPRWQRGTVGLGGLATTK